MFVRDWMSSPAFTLAPFVSAEGALNVMGRHGVRRMPVVEDGKLRGILTKNDLQKESGARREEVSVGELMTPRPLTVGPGETLERAAHLMLEHKIGGLPVVDGGRVVGIITESDVFRALCEMMGIGESGARVILTVPEGEDVLGAIGTRVKGLGLRSLVTLHDSRRGQWNVVVRVRGRVPAPARAARD